MQKRGMRQKARIYKNIKVEENVKWSVNARHFYNETPQEDITQVTITEISYIIKQIGKKPSQWWSKNYKNLQNKSHATEE